MGVGSRRLGQAFLGAVLLALPAVGQPSITTPGPSLLRASATPVFNSMPSPSSANPLAAC